MSGNIPEATGAQQKPACCTPKRAVYATAVTLLALAVIVGALVVVSYYANFRLPVASSIAHQLGKYSFIPLVASGGLLLLLGSLGIYQRCTSKKSEPHSEIENPDSVPSYARPARDSYYEQGPGNKASTKYHNGSVEYGPVRLIPNSSVYALGDATEKMQKQLRLALESAPKKESSQNFGFVTGKWDEIEVEQIAYTGVASSKGKRSCMEDAHLVMDFVFNGTFVSAWGVFDGHGDKGEAAHYVADKFCEYLREQLVGRDFSDETIANGLTHVFCRLHREVLAMREEREELRGGTCAICAVEIGGKIYIPNAGDSRAVLLRRGDAERLNPYQLSEDGVPNSPRFSQSIVKTGHTPVGGRVDAFIACARALGDPILLPRPKITYIQRDGEDAPEEGQLGYRQGDYLVFGCDGLFDVCSNTQLAQAIETMEQEGKETSEMARDLVKAAVLAECGDNVSVIVVQL